MKFLKSDFGPVFILHAMLIIFYYLSPWLLPWPLIILCLAYLIIQEIIFHGCLLSYIQFGSKENRKIKFFSYYFKRFGSKLDGKKIDLFFVWIMPSIILILAVILQEIVGVETYF